MSVKASSKEKSPNSSASYRFPDVQIRVAEHLPEAVRPMAELLEEVILHVARTLKTESGI